MNRALLALCLLACGDVDAQAIGGGAIGGGGSGAASSFNRCGNPPQTYNLVVWLDGRSVDGTGNATVSHNDAVTTWTNLGSAGASPTQPTGSARPAFIAGCINGEACIRFDGNDVLSATATPTVNLLHNGSDVTSYVLFKTTSSDPDALQVVMASVSVCGAGAYRGACLFADDSVSAVREDRAMNFVSTGAGTFNFALQGADDSLTAAQWHMLSSRTDDDGGAGADGFLYVDDVQVASSTNGTGYSASDHESYFSVGATSVGSNDLTGDVAQVLIYSVAHDATQRTAVMTWAECVYGGLPQ